MTDNEIIKDFEKVIVYQGFTSSVSKTLKNTLDLVNRLQAEKEALIAGQETMSKYIEEQQAEIEKLKEASEEAVSCFHRMESLYNIKCMELKVAKAEAVKEFEERAIKNICEKVYAPTPVQSCIVEKCNQVIIETAKEMVGET